MSSVDKRNIKIFYQNHHSWLYQLWSNLCNEYTYRYGRKHLTDTKLRKLLYHPPKHISVTKSFTQPPPAMPDDVKHTDSIIAYRNYYKIHKWSIQHKDQFWDAIWDFTKIIGNKKGAVLKNSDDFINSVFFENCELNFTENNLLKNDESDAIIYYSEQKQTKRYSWKKLKEYTFKLSYYFKNKGIKSHDRIVGVLPNIPETVIAFLSTAQIGAIWSSCSADFGPKAIIDRFKQIEPKILFVTDKYYYNNKLINTLKHVPTILKEIPSIKEVIVVPYSEKKTRNKIQLC